MIFLRAFIMKEEEYKRIEKQQKETFDRVSNAIVMGFLIYIISNFILFAANIKIFPRVFMDIFFQHFFELFIGWPLGVCLYLFILKMKGRKRLKKKTGNLIEK